MTNYIKRVANSLMLYMPDVYEGEEGAKRLAREVGWCLCDNDTKRARKKFDLSYNEICVKGYGLNPPLDKREWDEEVKKGWWRRCE